MCVTESICCFSSVRDCSIMIPKAQNHSLHFLSIDWCIGRNGPAISEASTEL